MYGQAYGQAPPMGLPMDAAAGAGMPGHPGFPCIKLRGLPYDVVEDDVPGFLGMSCIDVLFVKQQERFTGEAFVILPSPSQVEISLAKNKSYLGRRYVEVFRASKLDYYKAVTHEMMGGYPMQAPLYPSPTLGGVPRRRPDAMLTAPGYAPEGEVTTVLKLRGLPWAVRKDQIIDWFSDLPIQAPSQDSVHIVLDGGRPSGIAYVEFASPADAVQALVKDRQMMGQRYVEVFASNREEAARFAHGAGPMQ